MPSRAQNASALLWRLLRSFWFHFGCILACFRCHFRNCLLVRRFSRFQKKHPFDLDLPTSPGYGGVAPRKQWSISESLLSLILRSFSKFERTWFCCKTNVCYMIFSSKTIRFLIRFSLIFQCFFQSRPREAFFEGPGAHPASTGRFGCYFRFSKISIGSTLEHLLSPKSTFRYCIVLQKLFKESCVKLSNRIN